MMLRTTRLTGLACVLGLVTAPVFAQHRAWTMPADGGTAVVPRHDGHVAVPQAQLDNTSPTQPPTAHPNPLDGELRAVEVLSRGGHFEHDLGEVLPVGLTYFGALEQRKFFPAEYQRQVAAIAAAGYQYARVLFAVGGDPYWTGHEVPPHDITTARRRQDSRLAGLRGAGGWPGPGLCGGRVATVRLLWRLGQRLRRES